MTSEDLNEMLKEALVRGDAESAKAAITAYAAQEKEKLQKALKRSFIIDTLVRGIMSGSISGLACFGALAMLGSSLLEWGAGLGVLIGSGLSFKRAWELRKKMLAGLSALDQEVERRVGAFNKLIESRVSQKLGE